VQTVNFLTYVERECRMSEDKKNNEPSEISKPSEPRTCQIFVGGLRRPSKNQDENPKPASEDPSARGEG
jgi:hypothetical protein